MEFLTLLFKNAEIALIISVFVWIILIIAAVKFISVILQIRDSNKELVETNKQILKELKEANANSKTPPNQAKEMQEEKTESSYIPFIF